MFSSSLDCCSREHALYNLEKYIYIYAFGIYTFHQYEISPGFMTFALESNRNSKIESNYE